MTPNLMKEMQQLVRVVTLQRELDTLACLYKLLDDSAFRTFAFDKSYDPQCNRKYDVPDLKTEGLEDVEVGTTVGLIDFVKHFSLPCREQSRF